jgi:hypothetical protein
MATRAQGQASSQTGPRIASHDAGDVEVDCFEGAPRGVPPRERSAARSLIWAVDDLDSYLGDHPSQRMNRTAWVLAIAHADDDTLSTWRKFLKTG